MVEADHEAVIAGGKPIEQDAARIEMIHISVPHRKQRRDRLGG
jgi:hypothetical protein